MNLPTTATARAGKCADQVGGADLRPAQREVVDEMIDEHRHTDRLTRPGEAGGDDREHQHQPTRSGMARR